MKSVEDDDIREGLRSGDLDHAFRVLRTRYGEDVYGVCKAVLRDPLLADDARQDTFGKVFQKRKHVAAADSIAGYLMKMARNVAIDLYRKNARRRQLGQRHADDRAEGIVLPTGAPVVEPAELAALNACMNQLDPTVREALQMHADGLPWQHIAAAVDLPIDTIRMRVTRCLPGLQACIKGKADKV